MADTQYDKDEALHARLIAEADKAPDVPPEERDIVPFEGFTSGGATPRDLGDGVPFEDRKD